MVYRFAKKVYILTSNHWEVYPKYFVYTTFERVYRNFIYPPIFKGINEMVSISSDVNELGDIVLRLQEDRMSDSVWEDNLLERKVESDLKDLLKTLVAFANSVQPGHTAVILIGEQDDGTPLGVTNPENIQRRVRQECEKIFPDILWRSRVYEKGSKQCVRVEIEYSGDTPHFGSPAWIRRGAESIRASDQVFQMLIDIRTDIVRELSKWTTKDVTVFGQQGSSLPELDVYGKLNQLFADRWPWQDTTASLVSVNKFWVTLQKKDTGEVKSEPLKNLSLSFDHKNNRLKIIVGY